VPINDITTRGRQSTIEALDDVKVQVHTYDAEMGRTGGGVFTRRSVGDEQFQAQPFSRRGRYGARRTTTQPEGARQLLVG